MSFIVVLFCNTAISAHALLLNPVCFLCCSCGSSVRRKLGVPHPQGGTHLALLMKIQLLCTMVRLNFLCRPNIATLPKAELLLKIGKYLA